MRLPGASRRQRMRSSVAALVVWTVAVGGIAVVILRHRVRLVGIMLYLTLGWLGS
jgi:predicted membrane channel-forming protein YqfA (hemolysin III family)